MNAAKEARQAAQSVGYNPPATVTKEVHQHALVAISDIEAYIQPHNQPTQVEMFVSKVLKAYPFGLGDGSESDMYAKLEAYGAALSDLPMWAIEKSYGNIINDFDKAPSPKQMREYAEKHTLKYRWALYDLKRLKVGV